MRMFVCAFALALVLAAPSAAGADDPFVGEPPACGDPTVASLSVLDCDPVEAVPSLDASTPQTTGSRRRVHRGGRRRPAAPGVLSVAGGRSLLHGNRLGPARRDDGHRRLALCRVLLLDPGARERQDRAPRSPSAGADPGPRSSLPRHGGDPLHRLVELGRGQSRTDLVRGGNRGTAPDGGQELPRRARGHLVDQRVQLGRPPRRRKRTAKRPELRPLPVRRRRRVAAAGRRECLHRRTSARARSNDDRLQEHPPRLARGDHALLGRDVAVGPLVGPGGVRARRSSRWCPDTSRNERSRSLSDYLYAGRKPRRERTGRDRARARLLPAPRTIRSPAPPGATRPGSGSRRCPSRRCSSSSRSRSTRSGTRSGAGRRPRRPSSAMRGRPAMPLPAQPASVFNAETLALAQRLASSIRFSIAQGGGAPPGACGPPGEHIWCSGAWEGATFNAAVGSSDVLGRLTNVTLRRARRRGRARRAPSQRRDGVTSRSDAVTRLLRATRAGTMAGCTRASAPS